MLRYTRIDKPTKHRPFGRRLSIQHLEQRLTLSSSTGGGFVDVNISSDVSFLTSGSGVPTLIVSEENIGVILGGQNFDGILIIDNDGVVNLQGTLDLGPKIIDPPGLLPPDPGGGWVPPTGTQLPEKLPANEGSESEYEKTGLGMPFTSTGLNDLTRKISPSRGREISFHVASVTPPSSILRPERLAHNTSATQAEPTPRREAKQVSQTENNSSAAVSPKAVQTSAHSQQPESIPTESKNQPLSAIPNQPAISRQVDSIDLGEKQAISVKTTEASMQAESKQSDLVDPTEEEARSQVFADWRKRDLIALPVLVALVTGPRLVRQLYAKDGETQQLPPKKNRQTTAL